MEFKLLKEVRPDRRRLRESEKWEDQQVSLGSLEWGYQRWETERMVVVGEEHGGISVKN